MSQNDNLILVCGESTTGKSASLMNLENPEGVMYLNCESGKKLPFRSQFKEFVITDPFQVEEAFVKAEEMTDIHTIVIDSSTYLMDLYESMYVLTAKDTQKAWGEFAQYWKRIMQQHVAASSKNVIILAHTLTTHNEMKQTMETKVPVKGALKNQGIESYFSLAVSAKKIPITELEKYKNDLLVITEEEEALGFKHVFQTKTTKNTVDERMRGPMGMWTGKETYINNDVQLVLNKLKWFYN